MHDSNADQNIYKSATGHLPGDTSAAVIQRLREAGEITCYVADREEDLPPALRSQASGTATHAPWRQVGRKLLPGGGGH